MGSIEIDNLAVNGDVKHNDLDQKDGVHRLHDLVHRLEEENEFLSKEKPENDSTEHLNGFAAPNESNENENEERNDIYSLENAPPVDSSEYDAPEFQMDDSWLYESPVKQRIPGTPSKSSQCWMTENVSTPELLRIKGSLSEKLEIIAIENQKGRFQGLRRMADDDPRRMSTLSLDWDFEDEELTTSLGDDSLGPIPSPDGFDSRNLDIASGMRKRREVWGENQIVEDEYMPRKYDLGWSDDEEDFSPMEINLNQTQPRRPAGSQPVVRRGQQSGYNNESDFAVKPVGAVKPRRAALLDFDSSFDDSDSRYSNTSSPSSGYEDSGPVMPRGMKKKTPVLRGTAKKDNLRRSVTFNRQSYKKSSVEDLNSTYQVASFKRNNALRRSVTFVQQSPSIMQIEDLNATYQVASFKRYNNAASPRGSSSIAKPVQRRKPQESDSSNQVRPRGSNTNANQVRPRTSGGMNQSNNSDFSGNQVRPRGSSNNSNQVRPRTSGSANQSFANDSDSPPVRRRGAVQTAEVSPMPRRSLEPSMRAGQDARSSQPSLRAGQDPRSSQDIPVRRSLGSLPQPTKSKSSDNIPRPRKSFSPSGIARPRGQPAM